MDYNSNIKRTIISLFQFFSVALWFVYIYFNLWNFAVALSLYMRSINFYLGIPLVIFFIYSIALVFLPVSIIYAPRHGNKSKRKLFKIVTGTIAGLLIAGSISDLLIYKFFIGYDFKMGDPIFCNLVVYLHNLYGTACCLVMAFAYIFFGKYMTRNRLIAYLLYLLIFLLEIIPLLIAYYNGTLYQALIEKALLIIPQQFCLLVSLTLAFTSNLLWIEKIK